jgi:hypothetical protein
MAPVTASLASTINLWVKIDYSFKPMVKSQYVWLAAKVLHVS